MSDAGSDNYARVSTDEQAEKGYSLPSQIEAGRNYARNNGYEIVGEYMDDCSGREIDRPELNKLREFIGSHNVDALIIYSGDRLTRDLAHSIELRRELSLLNVELIKVLGGQVDDSPHGRFTENVMGAVSQLESEIIVERTQRGKNQRAKSGHMIYSGYAPYGYKKIGRGRDAKYVIDENEALIVSDIFEYYLNGNSSGEPMPLRAIARHLNQTGAPPPSNGPHSVTYWTPFTVRKILGNEIYTGRTYWGKTRMVNDKRIYQPKERWIPIDVPELAFIDPQTYEAAKKKAQRNKELAKRNRKNTYLLSGYFRCGTCGATMIGHKRKHGKNTYGLYYRCGNHWNEFIGLEKCGARAIDTVTHKVDNLVWDWLTNLLTDGEALETGLNEMMANKDKEINPKRERLKLIINFLEKKR